MRHPFFSIIIPVYNVADEYFRVCMDSLINQTYTDFEIIIVNDGSNSDTTSLCNSFMQYDNRVKVVFQINQGVSVARNNGIKESNGKWILFVDADDWLEFNALKKLHTYLENKDYDILCFRAIREKKDSISAIIDYGIKFDYTYQMENLEERILLYRKAMQPSGIIKDSVAKDTFYYIWNKVFNRDFLCNNNLAFPVGIPNSEDKIFILRCLMCAERLHSVADVLYHYRIIEGSATRRFSMTIDEDRKKMLIELKQIARQMEEELQAKGNNTYYHGTIIQDYYLFAYMIFSSVVLRKFYHESYMATKKERKQQTRYVMCSEPFAFAIASISYSRMTKKDKLRLWLFRHKKFALFANMTKYMH